MKIKRITLNLALYVTSVMALEVMLPLSALVIV